MNSEELLLSLQEKDRAKKIERDKQKELDELELNEELAKLVASQKKKKKSPFETSSLIKHSNSVSAGIAKCSKTPKIKVSKFDNKEIQLKSVKK